MLTRSPSVLALAALVAAALVSASAGGPSAGPPSGSPPGLDAAIAAQERHTDELLEHPGVVGTGVGLNPAGRPVVRIYVEAPPAAADLPNALDGVPVETVTTGIIMARAPSDRFPRPVPIGVSSGHPAITAGTLAARVTDGTNVYALSNNHVYAAMNSASIGDGIIQPGTADGGTDPADRIGTLADFQTITFNGSPNTIDAAIALTSTANVGTATPADGYGMPSPTTTTAFLGQAVKKYGRTTGLTNGTVAEINVTVDVCYVFFIVCLQQAHFVNQVSITPDAFSAGGDSGSLIVTQAGNQPVALLFAGGEGRTVGNPIDLVLQRFGVTIEGAAPPVTVPDSPTGLSALAGDTSVDLGWQAPAYDGGSPVTGYRVYRGTSPGGDSFLTALGPVTSFADTGLVNGTTYYYKVSAVNAIGEGALSTEATATPTNFVPPAEPLPVLDGFNRPNETLSDAGRWSNGVIGSAEVGLQVSSSQLACSLSTTCTAWRNNAQYGPDAESWARITTLPGNGNAVRLYLRLQTPGSSAADGYMLLFSQASGTDQVVLYRLSNGALTVLQTVAQEIAAGDTLLLRAEGTRLESWRHDGTAWSRLGTLNDSTYAAAGYVGVGVRGTTGRVDDFGGRTMASLPPLTITTVSLPAATAGQPYSQPVSASGGQTPYTWSLLSGSLPPGLSLASGTPSATISGTPTSPGSYPFTVEVTDGTQTATQALSIAVGGPTQVTASPDATTILTGTLRSGTAADLASDEDSYYEVNSTTKGMRTSAWYGSFTGVTNSLSNLRVSYTGKNSRSCTQTVAIWNWSNSTWVQLDSRTVGTTEVTIANLAPGGTLADYVSGTAGDGELRVRIRCRTSAGSFWSSGDLLQISYERP